MKLNVHVYAISRKMGILVFTMVRFEILLQPGKANLTGPGYIGWLTNLS